MFGYIKPHIPELKVCENELYKASYCGLCRTMGKRTGCLSNITLSYDFVFLALLRMAISEEKGIVKMRRCLLHPFKKRPMLEINSSLEYSAKTSTILTRLKLQDNINDTRGIRKLKAKIASLVSIFLRKTDKSLLPLAEKIKECIDNLAMLEKEECDSIDKLADSFGVLLGHVASFDIEGEKARIMYDVGYHLGKWIYVIDACDDLSDDVKSGSYNVLKHTFGEMLDDDNKAILQCAMNLELSSMSRSIELIDFTHSRDVEGIIKNIIYLGMPQEAKRVLEEKKPKKK